MNKTCISHTNIHVSVIQLESHTPTQQGTWPEHVLDFGWNSVSPRGRGKDRMAPIQLHSLLAPHQDTRLHSQSDVFSFIKEYFWDALRVIWLCMAKCHKNVFLLISLMIIFICFQMNCVKQRLCLTELSQLKYVEILECPFLATPLFKASLFPFLLFF